MYILQKYSLSHCFPLLSFRKTKRTGAGTSLVSLFVRNAACSLAKRSEQSPCILPHFDTLSERLTTLIVPFRVFVSQMLLRLSIANKFVLLSAFKAFSLASAMTTFLIIHTKLVC